MRGGVAGLRRPLLARVVDGIQHHLLAHDLGRRARGADQEGVGGRQRRQQLGPRQRVGARVREDALRPKMVPAALYLGVPLRVQPGRRRRGR